MPNAVAGATLDGVCQSSLEPMRSETQANARRLRQPGRRPKGGHLDEGVVTRKMESAGRFRRVFWIGFQNRARRIAHLVNFGTAPHYQPKRGIMHPGARPKPFFTNAYESKKDMVVRIFGQQTWNIIARAAVQLGRGGKR